MGLGRCYHFVGLSDPKRLVVRAQRGLDVVSTNCRDVGSGRDEVNRRHSRVLAELSVGAELE